MTILSTITQNLQSSISYIQVRQARTKAVRNALIAANIQNPDYQGIGFDETLLSNQAEAIMAPFLNDGVLPDVNELATAWATAWASKNQFSTGVAQKAAANITPMISDFIYALGTSDLSSETQAPTAITQPQSPESVYADSYPAKSYLRLSS